MTPQVVVADDLSGACDTGAAFATTGASVHVFGEYDHADIGTTGADIVVVDCDTRHRSEADAYARVSALLARVRPERPEELFLKIDSTLRGPIASVVRAVLDALPDARAIAAPAFPRQRRITRGGLQLIDDIPVHVGSAGSDPRAPIWTSRVAEALGSPERVRVFDAATDADLDTIAMQTGAIWIGAAGLASALARKRRIPQPPLPPPVSVIVVAGTINPVTHTQLAALAEAGTEVARIEPGDLLIENERLRALRRRLERIAAGGASFAISLDPSGRVVDHAAVLSALSGFVTSLPYDPSTTFLATGGETARALCRALGVHILVPLDEIEPGIPLSLALERDIRMITKAGGFGDPDTLARIVASAGRT